MTITVLPARNEYTATAAQTVFNYTFKIFSNTDLNVYITPQGQDADDSTDITIAYTVDPGTIGDEDGGFITLNVGATINDKVTIVSNVPESRTTDYQFNGDFIPDTVNDDFDRVVQLTKQTEDRSGRTLSFQESQQNASALSLPSPAATLFLRWKSDETGLENIDLTVSGTPTNANIITYSAGNNFAGGVDRTQENKNAEIVSVKDFGAAGDGIANDGPELSTALAFDGARLPLGTYENNNTAIVQDFADTAIFHPSADINNSGSGSTDFQGVTIREGYNPGGDTSWTSASGLSYEGLSADLGGYGPRTFGGTSTHTGVNGSVKVPASSTAGPHASGITGYCRTASTTTGAVAVYGEAVADATGVAIFGFNSRSIDDGIQATVWGSEIDINISNPASTVRGIDLTGGTTVQPATAEGFRLGPLGVFPPLIQWDRAFVTADNAAKCSLDIGSLLMTNSGMQPINGYFRDGGNNRIKVLDISADATGNLEIGSETAAFLFELKSGANKPVRMQGNNLGFYGTFPTGRPDITGSKGGNAALASLLTALAGMGLITDSTT